MKARVMGAIVAGGRARRMGGARKGLIECSAGETIIARELNEMKAAGIDKIVIVANEREPYVRFGKEVIPDITAGMGPLGGIEAALAYAAGSGEVDGVLFLPCDLPEISSREVRRLVEAFEKDPRGVKLAAVGGEAVEPLCCVAHTDVLERVREALAAGELAVGRLWKECGAETVAFDVRRPFCSVNTREDLEEMSRRGTHDKPERR